MLDINSKENTKIQSTSIKNNDEYNILGQYKNFNFKIIFKRLFSIDIYTN
jgi:hypothetical protein